MNIHYLQITCCSLWPMLLLKTALDTNCSKKFGSLAFTQKLFQLNCSARHMVDDLWLLARLAEVKILKFLVIFMIFALYYY
jgi:hypothetical protein